MAKRQIELPGAQPLSSPQAQPANTSLLDPLTEEQAAPLLALVDVIRDPLHGDIRLTALERSLIDTSEFQRLRHVNQLAMTYMAYPGAIHTRFIHSLGVLHVCSQMVETCNSNATNYCRLASSDHPIPLHITSYAILLARLCALVHDLAHVPFGHTLEKEGKIFLTDEWQDKHRLEALLGDTSGLADCMSRFFAARQLPKVAATSLLRDVRDILSAKARDVSRLPYPFVHDLVGNTICADLIDYVQRDMYFCGLTESLGKRFLEYLAVIAVEEVRPEKDGEASRQQPLRVEAPSVFRRTEIEKGKKSRACRLVLLQYRYNERRSFVKKHDIIAEAIDLVRRRLTVAEKLYFHRTKLAASAMLIAAAYSARLQAKALLGLSDLEVLKLLANSENRRASVIATKLLQRTLFKPVYRVSYYKPDGSPQSDHLWDGRKGAYTRFQKPQEREDLISRLERLIGITWGGGEEQGVGTVAISCPDKDMNLKAFDMLVLPHPEAPEISRLQDSEYGPTQLEIKAIQETHKHLWRLEVFVDPAIVPLDRSLPSVRKLIGAIQREVGLINESASFGDLPSVDLAELELETVLTSELNTLGMAEQISKTHYEELTAQRFRGSLPTKAEIEHFLIAKGYKA